MFSRKPQTDTAMNILVLCDRVQQKPAVTRHISRSYHTWDFVFQDRSDSTYKTPVFRSTANTGTPLKSLFSSCCFHSSSVNNPASSAVFVKASLLLSLPSVPKTNCVHYPCNLCLLLRNFPNLSGLKPFVAQGEVCHSGVELTDCLIW